MKKILIILLILFNLDAIWAKDSKPADSNQFAIYLSKSPESTWRIIIKPEDKGHPEAYEHRPENIDLDKIQLEDQPIIKEEDIVWYDIKNHDIKLSKSCFDNISKIKIPTSGRIFAVCVGKKRIYWGALWSSFSSMSFSGVVINIFPIINKKQADFIMTLELGYPSEGAFHGKDPRENSIIMKRLAKIGKLNGVVKYPTTEVVEGKKDVSVKPISVSEYRQNKKHERLLRIDIFNTEDLSEYIKILLNGICVIDRQYKPFGKYPKVSSSYYDISNETLEIEIYSEKSKIYSGKYKLENINRFDWGVGIKKHEDNTIPLKHDLPMYE
ncbi:MAG: hypothetical protein PHE88_03745 [Elusimicrobia bacterium]|nr:hypothetical protein [Elusimicrobiota bacterium]